MFPCLQRAVLLLLRKMVRLDGFAVAGRGGWQQNTGNPGQPTTGSASSRTKPQPRPLAPIAAHDHHYVAHFNLSTYLVPRGPHAARLDAGSTYTANGLFLTPAGLRELDGCFVFVSSLQPPQFPTQPRNLFTFARRRGSRTEQEGDATCIIPRSNDLSVVLRNLQRSLPGRTGIRQYTPLILSV